MSEDEAFRRIEVARLARRFPALFEYLASGRISLSVAALLKPYLTDTNHATLLTAVSGKTVQRAREVLACLFPRPDVPASIRKLPNRRGSASTDLGCTRHTTEARLIANEPAAAPIIAPKGTKALTVASQPAGVAVGSMPVLRSSPHGPPLSPPGPARLPARSIEPLSAERYKIQLTADAELKRKLELAIDLLRHAVPQGDLAIIIERAVDLLLEQTMKRRFGATTRRQRNTPGPAGTVALEQSRFDGQPCSKPAVKAAHGSSMITSPPSAKVAAIPRPTSEYFAAPTIVSRPSKPTVELPSPASWSAAAKINGDVASSSRAARVKSSRQRPASAGPGVPSPRHPRASERALSRGCTRARTEPNS